MYEVVVLVTAIVAIILDIVIGIVVIVDVIVIVVVIIVVTIEANQVFFCVEVDLVSLFFKVGFKLGLFKILILFLIIIN